MRLGASTIVPGVVPVGRSQVIRQSDREEHWLLPIYTDKTGVPSRPRWCCLVFVGIGTRTKGGQDACPDEELRTRRRTTLWGLRPGDRLGVGLRQTAKRRKYFVAASVGYLEESLDCRK